jgi:tellurite resistance protein TerC
MSFRRASAWSLVYVIAALLFGVLLGLLAGWNLGTQFLAGYVVEKSLSVDNLFVFVIIMTTFAVPVDVQPRALTLGMTLALLLRGVCIAVGAALLDAFSVTFLIFGIALIATALQLFRHRDEDPSLSDNPIVVLAKRRLPLTQAFHGNRIVTVEAGRRRLTPLFLVLLAIGTTDLLFAVDSIPAVYGLTSHPWIVLAANVFALLGLRTLFFLVAGLLDRLVYLSTGLAVILTLTGIDLLLHFAHLHERSVPELSTGLALAVIVVFLAVITVASLEKTKRDPTLHAHAGSLRHRRGAEGTDNLVHPHHAGGGAGTVRNE